MTIPESALAAVNKMTTPPLSMSPALPTSHTPCPSAPSCESFPSPLVSSENDSAPLGVTLRPPRRTINLDPWRRHTWEPGAGVLGYSQYENRSVSLDDLDSEEIEKVLGGGLGGKSGRDPHRTRIASYNQEQGSLGSLTEEELVPDPQHFCLLEEQSSQLQGCSASAPALCTAKPRTQSSTPRPWSHCYETSLCSSSGGYAQSELGFMFSSSGKRAEGESETIRGDEENMGCTLKRKLSIFRKMKGEHKNKEKERIKEREKEAREREARYSNGHLFTSLTVSGTTLCSACGKSITAKEALGCPTCSVTIHNRCRDSLPSCAKVKQRQQKSLGRNSSALQNVTMRTKTPGLKERPSSAIYPADSLRQSLLGSRRGRPALSLSKSVSTNNITGNLNEDSSLGLRKIISQSTESLNFRNRAMSLESLNDEGEMYYASMLEELQLEGRDFEADSWSTAVDSSYLQTQRKDVIKRQDVIYELIQTELHHVRTLRIMDGVFRRGMLEEMQLEPGVVHAIFPCLDRLLALHTCFLGRLLERRNQSLAPGSTSNFTIQRLGDLLVEQFSGPNADEMRKAYAEFCSRHLKAAKLYKELLARDKKFQHFIRRVSRGHLLRRHGVQECILLVTQRITKYPVLVQRILDNTNGSEQDASALSQALVLIRELLTSVDQQVLELGHIQRLQEIQARLDPRAEAQVRGGGVFTVAELMRRQLIHEGTLLWKTGGSRLKDVQVLLMTDILVFMQEKDQKFVFPSLDKPSILALRNLIVRDIANQERGMFLISDAAPPEMYELHASSREERNTWMRVIQQAVSSCPSREDFPLIETEDKARLRRLRADIQQKDRELLELLQERVTLFSELAEVTCVTLPSSSQNLFRADSPQAPSGEKLLMEAIGEVDNLSELLMGSIADDIQTPCCPNSDLTHKGELMINGQTLPINGTLESPARKDRNGNQLEDRALKQEVCRRLVNLSAQLHALQGAVIRQDSVVELCLQEGTVSPRVLAPGKTTDGGVTQQQQQQGVSQGEQVPLHGPGSNAKLLLVCQSQEGSAVLTEPPDNGDGNVPPQPGSPRDLQDIPEEGEGGSDVRETQADADPSCR